MTTEQILNSKSISTVSSIPEESLGAQIDLYRHVFINAILGVGFVQFGVLVNSPELHVIPSSVSPGSLLGIGASPHTARTHLAEIIDELDALKRRTSTIADFAFKPTKHAFRSVRFYIFETYAKMGHTFPRPFFVLDGEKGIIIKWVESGRTVRLNCLANESDQDYIYFENSEYDIEDNMTIDTLKNRLNWLIQHEREPAR